MTVTGNLPGLLIWTILPSNVAGRTKKSVTATVLFIAYCTGNAMGAQVFQATDAPRYIHGLTACGILYGVEVVLMLSWRYYCEYLTPVFCFWNLRTNHACLDI
jgi:ACS family allantoate permease-like MFS transporter